MLPVEQLLDGTIDAVEQTELAAQTSGRVAALPYDVDDFVPAGAVVVRLRSTEQHAGLAAAQAALREASSRQTEVQLRYQRIEDLYQHRVVAKASFDQAVAERDAAAARVAAAQAAVTQAEEGVDYTEVRAPYAGVVARRLVQVGQTVAPGTPLMRWLSLQSLRVDVDVPQSIVDEVRGSAEAAVYIGGQRIRATHVTIFPEAATPSNTFRARLDLPPGATDLYPGMFVPVAFRLGETAGVMIPRTAVLTRGELTEVYLLGPDDALSAAQVRLGRSMSDSIEVLAGLVPGDRVVLDPTQAAGRIEGVAGSPSGFP